jgi:hypothetical protein
MSDVIDKTPPLTLAEQLAMIDVSDQLHDELIAAAAGNVTNPTDSFGRTAIEIGRLKQAGFKIVPAMKCTNCGESLTWCRGVPGKVTPYFRHNSKTKCPGGYMSPWHAAMQTACAAKGFDTEHRIVIDGATRRLDAYHAGRRLCLEFVNSLSANYIVKHLQLVSCPIVTAWFFNSGSRFATNAGEERIDMAALSAAIIRIQNLFSEEGGAREIIEQIGRVNCYTIHRGLVFGCVGYDLWQCLPLCNPLQKLCVADRGFNFQLFAAGKMPRRDVKTGKPTGQMRVVRSRYALPSGHAVDPEHLLNELRTEVATGKLLTASALAVRKPQNIQQEGSGDISLKLPSDNDARTCDGMPRQARSTNNLAIAEVQEQIEKARLSWNGNDFDPWPIERETDVEVVEAEQVASAAIDVPASTAASVAVEQLQTAKREIRSRREDIPTENAAKGLEFWKTRPSAAIRNPKTIHAINRELLELSRFDSSRKPGECCSSPKVEVRNIAKVFWNECLTCGCRSRSWVMRRMGIGAS